MRALALAQTIIEWQMKQEDADALKGVIIKEVLWREKTQVVGNAHANYRTGRKKYDYEEAGTQAPEKVIEENTKTTTRTNWRKVCEDAGISKDDIPFTQSEPTVSLTIKEEE